VRSDPKAVIITVNFRQDQCTLEFLKSASKLAEFDSCHFLIVDNNSDDGSVNSIRRASLKFSNVTLLSSPQNGGYFGAANWALQRYLVNHDCPDWVIVCNNDIVFGDRRFLLRLVETNPTNAVIAPCIISGLTRCDANPSIRHRPSRFRMWRYRFWLSNFYLAWFKQALSPYVRRSRMRNNSGSDTEPFRRRPIYAPYGALVIFSRSFFDAGGFIDGGSFLYAEELRIAEMCRRLRLPIMHDPELRVWHKESQSTGRFLTRAVYQHQKNGFEYALSRYKNPYPELVPPSLPLAAPAPDPMLDSITVPIPGERAS